jgi:hypothetical protein
MSWERIGDLEGWYKNECTAEGEEEVASDESLETRLSEGHHHQHTTHSKKKAADKTTETRSISVEDSPNRERGHICRDGRDGEEKVEFEILFRTQLDPFTQFTLGTVVMEDTLFNKDRFEGGESKHNSRREPARENGERDLRCTTLATFPQPGRSTYLRASP